MRGFAKLTSKGQITVPLGIRERLGVREGDRIEFVTQGSEIVVRPARGDENPFASFVGALDTFPGGAPEVTAWVRSLRDDDSE